MRGARVADLVADDRIRRVEPGLQHRGELGARRVGVRAVVPFDRQRIERALRVPPRVGDDRDRGVADAHDFLDAGRFIATAASTLFTLPPNTGQSLIAAFSMPGSFEVHSVDLLAPVVLSTVSRRARRLPAIFQSFGSFSGTSVGRRELRRGSGDLAVASSVRPVGLCVITLFAAAHSDDRHLPVVGRRLHEHHARRRAALAHVLVANRGCRGCRRSRSCPRRDCARGSRRASDIRSSPSPSRTRAPRRRAGRGRSAIPGPSRSARCGSRRCRRACTTTQALISGRAAAPAPSAALPANGMWKPTTRLPAAAADAPRNRRAREMRSLMTCSRRRAGSTGRRSSCRRPSRRP